MAQDSIFTRVKAAGRAAVGVFTDDSVREAWGMLSGIQPGGLGNPPQRYTADFLKSYGQMPWLRAVTNKIATSVAQTEWKLYYRQGGDGKAVRDRSLARAPFEVRQRALKAATASPSDTDLREITDHPLLDVLDNANGFQTGLSMRKVTQLHLDLVGEAYWLKERDSMGVIVGVWPVPPHWVLNTPTPTNRFFRVQFRAWKGLIPDTEFLWFTDPDPLNPYARGVGTAMSLSDELETDEYVAKHTKSFFYNRAKPDLLIYPKEGMMRSEQVARLEQDWIARNQGFWKAFKPYFMTREIGVHEMDTGDFRSMRLVELREYERDCIIQTYGMPPELLGVIENSNRATIDAADYLMARYVTQPRLEFLRTNMQERLVPEFDERLILDYVSPVTEDKQSQLTAATVAPWAASVNEWRAMQGLPPMEDEKEGALHLIPNTYKAMSLTDASDAALKPAPGFDENGMPFPKPVPPGAPGDDGQEPPKAKPQDDTSGGRGGADDKALTARARLVGKSLFDAGASDHQGLLVSLWLKPEAAFALALDETFVTPEQDGDLHVTLAYCGDVAALGDVAVARAVVALSGVARGMPQLRGEVNGFGRFASSAQSDDKDVIYAVPDVPGLAELRMAVVQALRSAQVPERRDHGWVPHITLAYVQRGMQVPDLVAARVPLNFDELTVSVGEARVGLALGGDLDPEPYDPGPLALGGQAAAKGAAQALADRQEAGATRAVAAALRAGVEGVDVASLARAVASGGDDEAVRALAPYEAGAHLREALVTPIRGAFLRGGELGAVPLRRLGVQVRAGDVVGKQLVLDLQVINPEAVRWAEERAGDLVVGTAELQARVHAIVAQALQDGATPDEVAGMLRYAVVLTERQALAVAAFRARLQRSGVTGSALAAKVERYASAKLRERAWTIARTELMAATNRGQRALWRAAQERGMLRNMKQVFIVTDDEHVCDECAMLDGETADVDASFSGGDPPLHPNCRCTIGLIDDE